MSGRSKFDAAEMRDANAEIGGLLARAGDASFRAAMADQLAISIAMFAARPDIRSALERLGWRVTPMDA